MNLELFSKIKGRHMVFIVGFLAMMISSIWSPETANDICGLLTWCGIAILLFRD